MTFQEECALLAPLETFDPAAFRGDPDVPQRLCDFVLALAVIYNDLKDAIYAHVALTACKPEGPVQRTRAWGANLGARGHLVRGIIGTVRELLELIENSASDIEHPFFASVLQRLDRAARGAWTVLLAAASNTASDPLGKLLIRFRNSIAFHYEAAAFGKGYAHHFFIDRADDRGFVSRGTSMRESRFYFADAAAVGYLHAVVGKDQMEAMMNDVTGMVEDINRALFSIVDAFIQRRGPYRPHREESGT